MMREHLSAVLDGQRLSRRDMANCMAEVLRGEAADAQVAALLGALRVRGETVEELVGAALAVREVAVRVPSIGVVVDTCGTGGDARGTFNLSTAAALVASACGVTVAKHGNRSVSSKCGSADVLEALGARLDLDVPTLASLLVQTRLAFLFAPAHHPAFKRVANLRRELGVRTVFNLVGPLANPAGAQRQVLGVFDPRLAATMADVLLELGAQHALVVHGDGLDEVSVCGPTVVEEVHDGRRRRYVVTPDDLGLAVHPVESLRGGDAATNAAIILGVLDGTQGGPRDAVLANAAAALVVAGHATSLRAGVQRAAEVIDSGAARAHFERFLRVQSGGATILDAIVSRLPVASRPPELAVVSTTGGAAPAQEPLGFDASTSPPSDARVEESGHRIAANVAAGRTHSPRRASAVKPEYGAAEVRAPPVSGVNPEHGAVEVGAPSASAVKAEHGAVQVRTPSAPRVLASLESSPFAGGRFAAMLSARGGPTRLIAEVKRRSPSAGAIAAITDAAAYAQGCVAKGASAISVLTNEADFGGSLADLSTVRGAVEVPVLRKEFVVDPRQLGEAAALGADAVLLIVAVLGGGLRAMLAATRARGLDALVEVHDEHELTLALAAGASIIGINNRDLRTFHVDLSVSERLVNLVPAHLKVVAESGLRSQDDLDRLRRAGLSNFLVGEHFARGGSLSCA